MDSKWVWRVPVTACALRSDGGQMAGLGANFTLVSGPQIARSAFEVTWKSHSELLNNCFPVAILCYRMLRTLESKLPKLRKITQKLRTSEALIKSSPQRRYLLGHLTTWRVQIGLCKSYMFQAAGTYDE